MKHPPNEPMGQLSAHLDRAWDLVARGDLAGARVSAEKSLEIDANSADAHNLIGFILQAEGRAQEALDHYHRALELDNSFVDPMLNAAELLVHPLADFDAALAMVQEARFWLEDASPDARADAMLLEADIQLMRGDREAAAAVVAAVPEGPYENPRLSLALGRARLDTGDVDGALLLIRAATQQEPPSSDAFYYLGIALEAKRDRVGSLIAFLQSRELDSASESPPWTLSLNHFEGRVQAALGQVPPHVSKLLEGALVIVTELPGAEAVAEGVDPRMPVLLDALSRPGEPAKIGRVFVYKRNIERMAPSMFELDGETSRALAHEVEATFPGGVLRPLPGDPVDDVTGAETGESPPEPGEPPPASS